jgi:hypothetical protein
MILPQVKTEDEGLRVKNGASRALPPGLFFNSPQTSRFGNDSDQKKEQETRRFR